MVKRARPVSAPVTRTAVPTPKGKPDSYDPSAYYLVKLNKVVQNGGLTMRPRLLYTLSGTLAGKFKDAIESAEKV